MDTKRLKLFFLVLLLFSINCIRDKATDKYFNPDKLDQLDLENIKGFWTSDSLLVKTDSDYSTSIVNQDMLKCVSYKFHNKRVGVSVFPTKSLAIYSMELTISSVARVIHEDSTNTMSDLYWYSTSNPNMVFTNKWNTIIEVGYFDPNFDAVKDILYDTAFEIAKRVDNLSD